MVDRLSGDAGNVVYLFRPSRARAAPSPVETAPPGRVAAEAIGLILSRAELVARTWEGDEVMILTLRPGELDALAAIGAELEDVEDADPAEQDDAPEDDDPAEQDDAREDDDPDHGVDDLNHDDDDPAGGNIDDQPQDEPEAEAWFVPSRDLGIQAPAELIAAPNSPLGWDDAT